MSAGVEVGTSFDAVSGREVAFGHVICGISAGIHHPYPRTYARYENSNIIINVSFNRQRLDDAIRGLLDPLYAITITGDLGQTVSGPHYLCSEKKCNYGGVGDDATSAELHGDIDGFMLGYWLCTNNTIKWTSPLTGKEELIRSRMLKYKQNEVGAVKASHMLEEYYRTRADRPIGMKAGSGYDLDVTRRFFNFNITYSNLKNDFKSQTDNFHLAYNGKFYNSLPNSRRVTEAIKDFEKWCTSGGQLVIPVKLSAGNDFVPVHEKIPNGQIAYMADLDQEIADSGYDPQLVDTLDNDLLC